MGRYTKYIIFQPPHQTLPIAILFHYIIPHNSFRFQNIIAAGFCYIDRKGYVQVFGKSITLNKCSRKDKDPGIIQETIRPPQEYEEYDKDNYNIFRDKSFLTKK